MPLNRADLERFLEEHFSDTGTSPTYSQIADVFGVRVAEVGRFMAENDVRLERDHPRVPPEPVLPNEGPMRTDPAFRRQFGGMEDPQVTRIYRFLKMNKNREGVFVSDVAERFSIDPETVEVALSVLEGDGYSIYRRDDVVSGYPFRQERPVSSISVPVSSERFYVGVVSDTHFGSKAQQPTALRDFVEESEELYDPVCWMHVGDLVDGLDVYRGHPQELWLPGFESQVDYFCKTFPETGKDVYFIGGNHDESFIKKNGADPCRAVAARRDDFNFLGWGQGRMEVGGVSFMLGHPGGAPSKFATSKLDKILERLTLNGPLYDLPDVMLTGHFHTESYYRRFGVRCFMVASFQGQTPYLDAKNIESRIGGLVLEIRKKDGVIVGTTPHRSETFYPEVNDYPVFY